MDRTSYAIGPSNGGAGRAFLRLLLFTDLVFILLHVADALLGFSQDRLFDLGLDRAYPELFQYLKFLWITKLLVLAAVRSGALPYLAWALVFGLLLLDDSLRLHERAGGLLAAHFGLVVFLGVPAQALGELAAVAVAGGFVLALLGTAYALGADGFRRDSRGIGVRLLLLVACGVGVDVLQSSAQPETSLAWFLGLIEDGGELIAVSVVAGYVFTRVARPGCALDLPATRPLQSQAAATTFAAGSAGAAPFVRRPLLPAAAAAVSGAGPSASTASASVSLSRRTSIDRAAATMSPKPSPPTVQ